MSPAINALGKSVRNLMFPLLLSRGTWAALMRPLGPPLFPSPSQKHGADDAQSYEPQNATRPWQRLHYGAGEGRSC